MTDIPWYKYAEFHDNRTGHYWQMNWALRALYQKGLEEGRAVLTRDYYRYPKDEEARSTIAAFFTDQFKLAQIEDYGDAETLYLVSPETVATLHESSESGKLTAAVYTLDEKVMQEYVSLFDERTEERIDQTGQIYILGETRSGLELYELGKGGVALERGNYHSDVLRDYDFVRTELNAENPTGRLVLIDGIPGTGKTYLVRGLTQEVKDALFVFVPPAMVKKLGDPSFAPALLDIAEDTAGPKVLILEDADELLLKRDLSNMSSITAVLGITSGIFGELIDLRVIATTNARRIEIDDAMVRSGRLLRHLHVDKLSAEAANKRVSALLELEKTPFTRETALCDVYAKARELGWQPPPRKPTEKRKNKHLLAGILKG